PPPITMPSPHPMMGLL
ncbi:hypothetical protein D023_0643B, partial [Vibrio parahaemolyticus 3256]